MKTYCKAAILSCLAAGAGIAAYRRWTIRMPFKEFTRYALYMAVMDDEICRHEFYGPERAVKEFLTKFKTTSKFAVCEKVRFHIGFLALRAAGGVLQP